MDNKVKFKEIKFNHDYYKLQYFKNCHVALIAVFKVHYNDLSSHFIDYDTYYDDAEIQENAMYKSYGNYELPKTNLLLLLFATADSKLFTTCRKWTRQKEKFYRSNRGELFDIKLINMK